MRNNKQEFRRKGYFSKEKSSKTWKKIKDFTRVKMPKALRNITHSTEIGFILKSS
jgi:ribosomal protein L32E